MGSPCGRPLVLTARFGQFVNSGGVSARCKNCYLYFRGGFGFEFETESYFDSIPFLIWTIPLNLKVPTGSLLYMKLWVDFDFSSSINVDVDAGPAQAASSYDPQYTFSVDLGESISSPTAVDVKSSKWSNLQPLLAEDLMFQVRSRSGNRGNGHVHTQPRAPPHPRPTQAGVYRKRMGKGGPGSGGPAASPDTSGRLRCCGALMLNIRLPSVGARSGGRKMAELLRAHTRSQNSPAPRPPPLRAPSLACTARRPERRRVGRWRAI